MKQAQLNSAGSGRLNSSSLRLSLFVLTFAVCALGEGPLTAPPLGGGAPPPNGVVESEKGVIYSAVGKRDPFREPSNNILERDVAGENPLEKFGIDQFLLRALSAGTAVSRSKRGATPGGLASARLTLDSERSASAVSDVFLLISRNSRSAA